MGFGGAQCESVGFGGGSVVLSGAHGAMYMHLSERERDRKRETERDRERQRESEEAPLSCEFIITGHIMQL